MSSSGSTRLSSRHRDCHIREQRLDAALDVLGAGLREHGQEQNGSANKNRLHQT